MRCTVECKNCAHAWEIRDEPRALHPLTCTNCDAQAHARATEDLSSAVEDALAQLWHVSQTFNIEITVGTRTIPAAFKPPEKV